LASRLADGLDGAVARARGKSDFGGYLDIVCDFAFYGAIPLGFVLLDPAANGAAGAFLLAAFYVNGATFLGYAILAAKRGMETRSRGEKSLVLHRRTSGGHRDHPFLPGDRPGPKPFRPGRLDLRGLVPGHRRGPHGAGDRTFR
jgi:hypothetical protein